MSSMESRLSSLVTLSKRRSRRRGPRVTVGRVRLTVATVLAAAAIVAMMPRTASAANNLHVVEADPDTGFAIYRTGKPGRKEMREFCRLGIEEMMVLSGSAADHEVKYAEECPTLKVIYNVQQSDKVPVTKSFLREFDEWVMDAQAKGKKIAFRCECGCHRTGRLAAYYQMKFQNMSLEDARLVLRKHGKWMLFYPHIFKQTNALADYIAGRPCSTKAKYCVRDE